MAVICNKASICRNVDCQHHAPHEHTTGLCRKCKCVWLHEMLVNCVRAGTTD